MFHSAGIVLLTVVINGTSMRYLIKYLGMAEMAPSKQLVFTRAIRAIEAKGRQREKLAMRETVFGVDHLGGEPPVLPDGSRHARVHAAGQGERRGGRRRRRGGAAAADRGGSSRNGHRPPPGRPTSRTRRGAAR